MDPVQQKEPEIRVDNLAVADDPFVGRIVSTRYKLVERIGVGGWGAVYRAEHVELGTNFAVKLLHRNYTMGEAEKRRFKYEAQAASRVAHTNVARTFDYGVTEDGHAYLVMEYLRGIDLAQYVSKHGPLPENTVVEFFTQACRGLSAAHACGIIHRDIKPSNLMVLDETHEIKILDFGLAKVHDNAISATSMTDTGNTVGTPQYMSPEQCSGQTLDERSDIYSLGCCIYEALTGRRAFDGNSVLEILNSHFHDLPPRPSTLKLPNKISKGIENVVYKALSIEACSRQSSAAELEKELTSRRATGYVRRQPPKTRQQFLLIFMMTCLLAASVVVIASAPDERPAPVVLPPPMDSKATTWDALDTRGQAAMNEGDYQSARRDFEAAVQDPSASTHERIRTLQKLSLLCRIEKKTDEQIKLDKQITQLSKTAHDGHESEASQKALSKTLSLLPNNPSPKQLADMESLSQDIMKVAREMKDDRESASAANLVISALNQLERPLGPTSPTILQMNNLLVDSLRCSSQQKKALAVAQKIKSLRITPNPQNMALLCELDVLHAELLSDLDAVDEAMSRIDEVVRKYGDKDVPKALLLRARLLHAGLLRVQLKLEPALTELKAIAEAAQNAKETKSAQTALSDIANIYALENKFPAAEAAFKQLLETQKFSTLERAEILNDLGDLYYRQEWRDQQWINAGPCFREALLIRQHLLSPRTSEVRDSLKSWMSFNVPWGNWKTGKISLNAAIACAQQLEAIDASRHRMNEKQKAELNGHLAYLLFTVGRKQEAAPYVDRVLEAVRNSDDISEPVDLNFIDTAIALRGNNVLDELAKLYESRVALQQRIAAEKPSVAQDIEVAKAYDNLGGVAYRMGNMTKATECADRAKEAIVKHEPSTLSGHQKWVAYGILCNFAMMRMKNGHSDWGEWSRTAKKYGYYQ